MQCLSVLRVIACGRAARPGCARCARHHGALKYEVWARPHYSPTSPTHNMHSEGSINRPGTTLSQLNDEVPQAGGPVTDPTYKGRLVSRRQVTTSTKKSKGVTPDDIPSVAQRKQSFATGSDRERLPPGMHPDRFQKLLLRSRHLSVWASRRPGALNAVRRLPRRLRIRLKKLVLGRILPVLSPRPFLMYTCNTEQQLAHFFGLPSDGSSMEVGRHEYLDLQDAEGELGYRECIFSSSSISTSLRAELQHTAEDDLKSGPSAAVMKDVGVPDHAGGLLQSRGRLVMNEGLVLTELSAGTVTDNIVRSIDFDDSVLLPEELTKNAGRSPPSESAGSWQVPSSPPSEPAGPWQVPSSPPSEPAGPWQVPAIRFVNHWGRQYGTPILGSRLIRPGLLSSDGVNGSGAQRLVQPDGGIPVMTPWKRCKLRHRAKTSNTEGKGLQLHGNQYDLMSHATAKEWFPLRPLVIIRPK
ncbi:hypothetical protein CEUSTIGMA_g2731.t1 [Chlamydomonas eustigma]|uniref:Uncharacterized protein n=1 Tax=Chlamydomonas eustigma TaxID=1157962 RepID=A0A250WWY1_9CHLO|nr:hypothetical protein CEUSTIGMA_g2731.t1 [Chlamydomonas eustigma]|eukprot:GAX75286.1 hypothetical protein CEUSTIGMA_g2731.t1 [Chlamydomonas eustigma]